MCAMCGGATEAEMRAACEKLRRDLDGDHVLAVMYREHDVILGFLDELEGLNQALQKTGSSDEAGDLLGKLKAVAEHLIEAEPHHQREEEVLFQRLEARGVYGPPHVMRAEHKELRAAKHRLLELAGNSFPDDFAAYRQAVNSVTQTLVISLRNHINKENLILYPMAVRTISEQEKWNEMKIEAEKIGDCAFTPPA